MICVTISYIYEKDLLQTFPIHSSIQNATLLLGKIGSKTDRNTMLRVHVCW